VTRIIGIAGGSASGKTTVAKALAAAAAGRVALIGDDDYYLPFPRGVDPDRYNFDAPAAKDLPLLCAHLKAARAGEAFAKPVYDLKEHRRSDESETVAPADVVIVEGLHAFATPALAAAYDLKVFIDAEETLRLGRRMIRDVMERKRTADSGFRQFFTNVRPMHDASVEPQRAQADLVIVSTFAGGADEAAAQAAAILQTLGVIPDSAQR